MKAVKTGSIAAILALALVCSGCWYVIAGGAMTAGALGVQYIANHIGHHSTPTPTPASK